MIRECLYYIWCELSNEPLVFLHLLAYPLAPHLIESQRSSSAAAAAAASRGVIHLTKLSLLILTKRYDA